MLFLLSPAKSLTDRNPQPDLETTAARLQSDTGALVRRMRRVNRAAMRGLMGISEPLADLNVRRYKAFDLAGPTGSPAILTFDGEVYRGLDAPTLDDADLSWAQDHLRILSGLYGVLRPLDLMQPYRLEMGVSLDTRRGSTLYDFWGDRVSRLLRDDAAHGADPSVINLASEEYARVVRPLRGLNRIDVRFLEVADGRSRVIGVHAKRARGLMARWAIRNRIERSPDLTAFSEAGYRFEAAVSTPTELVFARPQPATLA